jgi:beta-glucosidase
LPLDAAQLKNVLVLGPNADKKHGTGGGSSQVKSLYEITPLQGLIEKLGPEVKVTYMQAKSDAGLLPIAGDFVASRAAGAGTPAWRSIVYKNPERKGKAEWSWLPDSSYKWPANSPMRYATLKADILPLADGEHLLKYSALGKLRLKINGEQIFDETLDELTVHSKAVTLQAGKQYKFELEYDGNQEFVLGWDAPGSSRVARDDYMAAARAADAVLYFGGLSHADDRESKDRVDMVLPKLQDSVISDLLDANANTIVFMIAGSAVEMPWAERAKAVVWGWYGGMEAGRAYANVLLGDINPSGKMPITLPQKLTDSAPYKLDDYNAQTSLYKEGVFIGHRWYEQQQIKPSFAFGHGLSYTSFSYDSVKLSRQSLGKGESLVVKVKITNTGEQAGAEVVQLYLSDLQASVPRPAKELKGFGKVFLQPKESAEVEMLLTERELSFWDVNTNNWLAEAGEFKLHIGAASDDIRLTQSFNYQ